MGERSNSSGYGTDPQINEDWTTSSTHDYTLLFFEMLPKRERMRLHELHMGGYAHFIDHLMRGHYQKSTYLSETSPCFRLNSCWPTKSLNNTLL